MSLPNHAPAGHDDEPPSGGPPAAGDVPPAADDMHAAAGERRMSRRAAWLAMGAVLLALVLVWLAPGVQDQHVDPADAALVGRPAPLHFTLEDMNGVDVKLESFRGKVILINFWATWCGPCVIEIPDLVQLQSAYKDDVVVLGVSIDDTAEALKPYAAKMEMNYPVLLGLDRQDMQDAYGPLFGIPVSVFVDRDGTIARRHSGILSREQMEDWIKDLL